MTFDKKHTPANFADAVKLGQMIVDGGWVQAPTTPSINTVNRVNVSPGVAVVGGKKVEIQAQADVSCVGSVGGAVVADEKEKKFAYVAILRAGQSAPNMVWVESAETTFGTEPPDVTDANVQAIYGNVPFLIVGQARITRTGGTTMAETYQYDTRQGLGYGA